MSVSILDIGDGLKLATGWIVSEALLGHAVQGQLLPVLCLGAWGMSCNAIFRWLLLCWTWRCLGESNYEPWLFVTTAGPEVI